MKNAIFMELAYRDIAGFPLTASELFHFSYGDNAPKSYSETISELNILSEQKLIHSRNGYYFFPNKETAIARRERSVRFVDSKLRIAAKAAKKLRFIPFIKAVFACNTVADGAVNENSDIDVFIIAERNRLWITRLLSTLLLTFFRLRRNKSKIKNRVCLSFYITNDALNLKKIAIGGVDIYLAHWINQLIPIFDPNKIASEFASANNWTKQYLPRTLNICYSAPRIRVSDTMRSRLWRHFWEKLWTGKYGDMIEKQAKDIQLIHMKKNAKSKQSEKSTNVILSDQMLKFHEEDRREHFRNEWKKRCDNLGIYD